MLFLEARYTAQRDEMFFAGVFLGSIIGAFTVFVWVLSETKRMLRR